jgi:methylmalonyl-CoA/ethylmalonyl-CoA epimerase
LKIHHVGYVVRDTAAAMEQCRALGFEPLTVSLYDAPRDADIVFLQNGCYRIELVAPRSERSVAWGVLKSRGPGPYHVCFECPDVARTAEALREQGYLPLRPPEPAPALGGRLVLFLAGRHTGMIELVGEAA